MNGKEEKPHFIVRHRGNTWCFERVTRLQPKHRNWKRVTNLDAVVECVKRWAEKK